MKAQEEILSWMKWCLPVAVGAGGFWGGVGGSLHVCTHPRLLCWPSPDWLGREAESWWRVLNGWYRRVGGFGALQCSAVLCVPRTTWNRPIGAWGSGHVLVRGDRPGGDLLVRCPVHCTPAHTVWAGWVSPLRPLWTGHHWCICIYMYWTYVNRVRVLLVLFIF